MAPLDFLRFVYLDGFWEDWLDIGLSDESDLWDLETAIMLNPAGGQVVSGTGGVRKLRWAPRNWRQGKSGSLRLFYVYLQEHAVILMIQFLLKSAKENISHAERNALKRFITEIKQSLESRRYH